MTGLRKTIAVCAAVMAMAPLPALAGPLPGNALDGDKQAWFYNKPGVSLEQYKQDMTYCRELAAKMTAGSTTAVSINPIAALVATAVVAAMDAAQDAGRRNAFADDCMVANVYRRFDIAGSAQRDFRTRLEGLDAVQLAAFVAAETPAEGVLGRVWVNSFQRSAPTEAVAPFRALHPGAIAHGPRSHTVAAARADKPFETAAGDAILVGSIRSATEALGNHSITLARIDPATGGGAMAPVGRRQRQAVPTFTLLQNASRADGRENVDTPRLHAFSVPPGHYALTGYIGGMQGVQMCLRTIAFEAKAGEVLHIGDWVSQSGEREVQTGAIVSTLLLVPNPNVVKVTSFAQLGLEGFNLESARAALAGAPAGSAERLAPAIWMNGAAYPCVPVAGAMAYASIYGFDLPGASPLNSLAVAVAAPAPDASPPVAAAAAVETPPPQAAAASEAPPQAPADQPAPPPPAAPTATPPGG